MAILIYTNRKNQITMKKFLILPAALFVLMSCNVAGDSDYEDMAKDACDCVNKSTKELSPEMIEVIISSEGDKDKLSEKMTAYAQDNPMQAMADATKMQNTMMPELTACMGTLEKKYKNVYTSESEAEVQVKLLEFMKKLEGCESSVAFIKMGINN